MRSRLLTALGVALAMGPAAAPIASALLLR